MKTCKCGCDGIILEKAWYKYTGIPNYIHGHNPPWNRGLTYQTDERVKRNIDNRKGYKHSEKTKTILREKAQSKKSKKYRKRISLIMKEVMNKNSVKIKCKNSALKRMEREENDGLSFIPCIGKYEKQILDEIEKDWNIEIKRQYQIGRYFLDGYCETKNLAIEILEPYHEKQVNKDMEREKYIVKRKECDFLKIWIGG